MESVLCWPTAPEHWICPGVWLRFSIGKKLICPFPVAKRFLVWGGVFIPLLLLRDGVMSGVNLCRHCACYHSLSNFIWISPAVSNKIGSGLIVSTYL